MRPRHESKPSTDQTVSKHLLFIFLSGPPKPTHPISTPTTPKPKPTPNPTLNPTPPPSTPRNLFDYDQVVNTQRDKIYSERRKALLSGDLAPMMVRRRMGANARAVRR